MKKLVLLFFYFIISGCQSDTETRVNSSLIVNNDKYYAETRNDDDKIISTIYKDWNQNLELKEQYYYNGNDSLSKKKIQRIIQDSIRNDSTIYSFTKEDNNLERTILDFREGQLLMKKVFTEFYEGVKKLEMKRKIIFYNEFKESYDTTVTRSTYSYQNDRLLKEMFFGEYATVSFNFIYDGRLISEKVVYDEVELDTLTTFEYEYKENYVYKVVQKNFNDNTKLISIYNPQGILINGFFESSDNTSDTINVNITEDQKLIEYTWDSKFNPSFKFEY
jgi:hypothetical protein